MTLTPGYNRKLERAFPFQCPRVRWSNQREAWQLEKKIHRSRTVNPDTYPSEAMDSFLRFRDGYELIDELPPRGLPTIDQLIHNLHKFSVTRIMEELGIHTASQLADAYDTRDRARTEKQREARNERWRQMAGPIHDTFGTQRVVTSGNGR